ncbi:MAG TPA: class I SAM-dependent methyltransferase, partial [Gammaproteobacteria bacterium]
LEIAGQRGARALHAADAVGAQQAQEIERGRAQRRRRVRGIGIEPQPLAVDAASYRYLAESIRRHPDQETLKAMMERAGFERCEYFNLTAGVVALHLGFRL